METKKTNRQKGMICPICECDDCQELIVDLLMCNSCSHIFKKVSLALPISATQLHKYTKPVYQLRAMAEKLEDGQKIMFRFPAMIFCTMQISPSQFYQSDQNHYFNQMSLMILLERCDLVPITQMNVWRNNIAVTCVVVEKNRGKK